MICKAIEDVFDENSSSWLDNNSKCIVQSHLNAMYRSIDNTTLELLQHPINTFVNDVNHLDLRAKLVLCVVKQ